jgi:hypothetical protein
LTRAGKTIAVLKREPPPRPAPNEPVPDHPAPAALDTTVLCDADFETWYSWCAKLDQRRLRPVFFHAHDAGGAPRFAVIATKNDPGVRWHLVFNPDPTGDIPENMRDKHPRPLCGTSSLDGQTRKYASIWYLDRRVADSLSYYPSKANYEAQLKEMKQKGQRPDQLTGYPTPDGGGFGVIWVKDDGTPYRVRHDLTADEYQAFLKAGRDEEFWPISVSAYPHEGKLRFTAVLLKNKAKREWQASQGLTAAEFHEQHKRWRAQGYRLLILSGYWQDKASHYLAIWIKGEPP